jgi:outer membrane lipase/esterase
MPNAPNLALVPAVRMLGPQAQGAAQLLSGQFNAGLEQVLSGLTASLPIDIVRLDVHAIIAEVVAEPAKAGFADAVNACITPGIVAGAFCTRPDAYLFWDGIHPTRAGHALLARRAAAALRP